MSECLDKEALNTAVGPSSEGVLAGAERIEFRLCGRLHPLVDVARETELDARGRKCEARQLSLALPQAGFQSPLPVYGAGDAGSRDPGSGSQERGAGGNAPESSLRRSFSLSPVCQLWSVTRSRPTRSGSC